MDADIKFVPSTNVIKGPPPQTEVVLTAVSTGNEPAYAANLFAYQGLAVRLHDQDQSNCKIDFGRFVMEPNKIDDQYIKTAFQFGADFHIRVKVLPEFDNVGKPDPDPRLGQPLVRPRGFRLLYRWSAWAKGLDGGITPIGESGPIRLPADGVHWGMEGKVHFLVSFETDQPFTPVIGFGAIQVITETSDGQSPNTHEMSLLGDSSYAASKK